MINQANAALHEHMSREHSALVEKFEIADLMKEIWKEKVCVREWMYLLAYRPG